MKTYPLYLQDVMASSDKKDATYKVVIKMVGKSRSQKYDNVVDILFNDSVVVLVFERECIYFRAKHIVSFDALKEET